MRAGKKQKLGLALGSGAARGLAHIGVLQALAEAGWAPSVVAGTSAGALVGGLFAAGKLAEFEAVVRGLDWKQAARFFLEVSFPRSGLIEGTKITEFLAKLAGRRRIQDLPVVFAAVAADISSGREVLLGEGDLVAAIRASIAVPGIFTPVKRRDDLLVDGGLVNPVPVNVCRVLGAEYVIAVDLNRGRLRDHRSAADGGEGRAGAVSPRAGDGAEAILQWLEDRAGRLDARILTQVRAWAERRAMPNIFDVLGNSLRIMESQIAAARLKAEPPDLLLRPRVGHVQFLEFHRAEELIEEGYRATKEALAAGLPV